MDFEAQIERNRDVSVVKEEPRSETLNLLADASNAMESVMVPVVEKGKSGVMGHEEDPARPIITQYKATTKNKRIGHFECPIPSCGRVYKRKGDLKVHMVKKHKETETSVYSDIMKPRSSAEGKTFICPYPDCGETHGYLRMRGLRRHLVLKHGGKLPKGLKSTDENAYLFRTNLARRDSSLSSSSSSAPPSSSSEEENEKASEEIKKEAEEREEVREIPKDSPEAMQSPPEDMIEQQMETPAEGEAVSRVDSVKVGAGHNAVDVRTSKRIRKPKVRESPDHPHKKRKYTRRSVEGDPMTLKIPSAMVDELQEEEEREEEYDVDSEAHLALPAAQLMTPYTMSPPGYYPDMRSSFTGSFSYTTDELYDAAESPSYLPMMPYSYPPVYNRGPMPGREGYYPSPYYHPYIRPGPSMMSQHPMSMPPMLQMSPNALPRAAEGMPNAVFGSSSPRSTAVIFNESYLPPAPLTSYLHAMGPFPFAMPFNNNLNNPPSIPLKKEE